MTVVISVPCEIYPRCIYVPFGPRNQISCFSIDEGPMAGAPCMKSEINRLNSFKNWPAWATQSPATLAKAGLYYTGTGDRVECPFCFGILKKWQVDDVPLQEHRTHFPHCTFIQGDNVGNVAVDDHDREQTRSFLPCITQETLQTEDGCDYTREATRFDSFSRWPPNVTQTPETLARAGFYHIPCKEKPDRVICAYCRGKLYNWASGDDPWIEHAKCFPTCPYIRLCFGNTAPDPQSNPQKRNENQWEMVHVLNSSEAEVNTTAHEVTKLMQSDAARAVLQMGFTPDLVRAALHVWRTGRNVDSVSAQELAVSVLEIADEGTPNRVFDTGSTTPNRHATHHEVTKDTSASDRKQISGQALWDVTETVDRVRTARDRNAPMRERHLCKVCMENQLRVTFIPCGHLACCGPCSMAMSDCPICRTPIKSCVRSYF